MIQLTDRQRQVLECVEDSIKSRGIPPTLRELRDRLGIRSTNGVNDHLTALERKGYIVRLDQKSRGLQVLRRTRPRECCNDARRDERERMVRKVALLRASGYDDDTLDSVLRRLGVDPSEVVNHA